jgi:hypothetical protein
MPAGDKAFWSDVANLVNKPMCRLTQQAAGVQSLASNVQVAITFGAGSEDYDSLNFHDTVTNNSRVTPNVAGWYRATGMLWLAGATTTTSFWAAIAKNGTLIQLNRIRPDAAVGTAPSAQVTTLAQMNGSTDYLEMIGLQVDSGAAARSTVTGVGTNCTLEVEYVRP